VNHKFTGPRHTIGIEEELMILDAQTLELANAIEAMLEDPVVEGGEIKPELHESVLEVATEPCRTTAEAAEQLRGLRAAVREKAAGRGYTIGSAGTHPFAMWEDQRIVARPRYRDLISALRFVARQEIIFGMHVHVGVEGADRAVHIANGCPPTRRSGAPTRPAWPRRARRSSARSRAWASRRATSRGATTPSASSSWSIAA
jgi:carboxylate-amine ligase